MFRVETSNLRRVSEGTADARVATRRATPPRLFGKSASPLPFDERNMRAGIGHKAEDR